MMSNEADDRPGAPLCIECWLRIDEQVRTEKTEPVVVEPWGHAGGVQLLVEEHNRAILSGGRESAIALFGGLVDRLVTPSPGTRQN
jgi:hypothetical protein